jgi:hypothetical protein
LKALEQHAKSTKLKSKKIENLGAACSGKKNGSSRVASVNKKLEALELTCISKTLEALELHA